LRPCDFKAEMGKNDLSILRHSCAHVMASAVKRLWPQAKLAIGPAIENGFYYDFDFEGEVISEADLEKIEREMHRIIKEDYPFVQEFWPRQKAIEFFQKRQERYKLELINSIAEEELSIFKHAEFIDLCRGPHLASTSQIKFFKLLSLAGAYWRGDEHQPMLRRIYGTAFYSKEELEHYLHFLQEAKERDHRYLGPRLGLFNIYPEQAGAGLIFYLPQGAVLRRTIEDWLIKEHQRRGYYLVSTPHIFSEKIFKTSGHLDYYADYMYKVSSPAGEPLILKPMNCPGHMLIFKSRLRSWRDLPLRLFELGTVYRYERSGVLHGLLRVRGFTQDDAHIFCQEEQLEGEVGGVLEFVESAMSKFGFSEFEAELSTRPSSFIGEEKLWDKAEAILEEALKKKITNYQINKGEGAFYGPKIDIKLKDVLGKRWQCATVQLDFALPQRFNLYYIDREGQKRRPVMLHRVILGSLERFIATLIEHYKGALPFWLAPVQIKIIPLKEEQAEYASRIYQRLLDKSLRVVLDSVGESLSKRIRTAELEKVPFILIMGRKEQENQGVNVRTRGREVLGFMKEEDFLSLPDIKDFLEGGS